MTHPLTPLCLILYREFGNVIYSNLDTLESHQKEKHSLSLVLLDSRQRGVCGWFIESRQLCPAEPKNPVIKW
jgi:hypothetical protein